MKKIIFTVLMVWWLSACEKSPETTKPQLEELVVSVYASVLIQPDHFYAIQAEKSGLLQAVLVDDGDVVKKGQVLAKIEARDETYALATATYHQQLATEKLKGSTNLLFTMQKEIDLLTKQFQNDSINYARQKALWQQQVGTQADYDAKKVKFQMSLDDLVLAQKKRAQVAFELENNWKQSLNKLKQSKDALSDYVIRATSDARVYQLTKKAGEQINKQEVFAKVGDSDSFLIEMQIDELDIAKVKPGQSVVMTLDAFEDRVFEAKVTKIYPLKNSQKQTFKIEARFINQPSPLYAGLAGEANIIIQKQEKALTIPLEYLTAPNKVLTAEGELSVVLGRKNLERIEVLSGLDTATVLLKPNQ